jgi:hypothetical protein
MPAYVSLAVEQFVDSDTSTIVGLLQQAYARDGFSSQYMRQIKAWSRIVPEFRATLSRLSSVRPAARAWTILFEYPLYRLRRRIDIVILAGGVIIVIECKVGSDKLVAQDRRQVEEYALDLRDFHSLSNSRRIIPLLWSTERQAGPEQRVLHGNSAASTVDPVVEVDSEELGNYLSTVSTTDGGPHINPTDWDRSDYRPVPSVIEAATSIFAGHDVRSIANADAENLDRAAARLVALIAEAKQRRRRYLLILTGVPGSGKTLAGLDVVHSAIASGVERPGDIIYLSGNTPLVVVLREALARDQAARARQAGVKITLREIRLKVRARIQHINDYLQQSFLGATDSAPHEHVIVFDEAQRAWDEKQGIEKFERTASEPALLLEVLSRHPDWCACVCLIGSGQEINSGEEGVRGWGDALRALEPKRRAEWSIFAPPDLIDSGDSVDPQRLGEFGPEFERSVEQNLELRVPQRSFRSPSVSRWVDLVLAGNAQGSCALARELSKYPLGLTRSLSRAKSWLEMRGRGERRFGLLASSGARRLRADGLGVLLNASAGDEIAHWYLNDPGDVRSSFALEVPANEYTCQGLELDFTSVCWGGDLLWDREAGKWRLSRFAGSNWQRVRSPDAQRFVTNSYRVLLTRAREGMIVWVPLGDTRDRTRAPSALDDTATYLMECGVQSLDESFSGGSV